MFRYLCGLAERGAFHLHPVGPPGTAVTPGTIARGKAMGDPMMAPYKDIVRMHLLIFFFAAAHFARLENFVVFAVVYAVCFFPWRLLRRGSAASPSSSA